MRRLFLALLIVLSGSDQTIAAPRITTKELLGPVRIINLLDSSAFAPGNDAGKAHEKFAGNLVLGAGEMRTWPAQILPREIHGKDPRVFPGVTLGFITVQEDLVPI